MRLRWRIPPLRKVAVVLVVALSVAACGSSKPVKTQAQIQKCWRTQLTRYAQQYANSLTSGLPGTASTPSQALVTNSGQVIADAAGMYEAGKSNPSLTTPAWQAEFKSVQAKCGKLKMKMKS